LIRLTRSRVLLVAAFALVLLAAVPAAASAGAGVSNERFRVDGFGEAFFGCPAFFSPAGTICRETHIAIFREAGTSNGGPIPKGAAWTISVESYTLEFVSDDPNVPPIGPIDYAFGTAANPAVVFDEQHLLTAGVDASVLMSDGTTAIVHATWSSTSDRDVFGNNGPFLAGNGLPRHYVDSCVTANVNAHQKLRFATATGTLNGIPFQSYSDFAFAAWLHTSQFLFLDVTHGGSCA
jgi:hypothetical protein